MERQGPEAFRVNKKERTTFPSWCRGEYGIGIVARFILLFVLWIWYGMVPHKWPYGSLVLITLGMLTYCLVLYRRQRTGMTIFIFLAAVLNMILVFGIDPSVNLALIAIIYFILFVDIVLAPCN